MAKTTPETADAAKNARFMVRGQYVKDISFENPNAPQSLMPSEEKPKIDVNVDINAQKLADNLYEVTLRVHATAKTASQALFVIELDYAGLFALENIPEDRVEGLLFVDCPFVLFPFARRVVSDVTRDGGYPPLMLEPIDFHGLYQQRKKQK
jgi:preprotein translocase subunit SecB